VHGTFDLNLHEHYHELVLLHCCARMWEEDYVIFVCINYRYHLMRMCVDFLFQSTINACVVISFLI
jgi:hypothetical protein